MHKMQALAFPKFSCMIVFYIKNHCGFVFFWLGLFVWFGFFPQYYLLKSLGVSVGMVLFGILALTQENIVNA